MYVFFQVVILKTSTPQVAVTTTSMVPTYMGFDLQDQGYSPQQYYDILRGDLLIVQNIEPRVGDVIVFSTKNLDIQCPYNQNSVPVVHRIVAEKNVNGNHFYETKGDHNHFTDAGDCRGLGFSWIPRSNVLGVVVFSIHYLGWFSLQLQDPFIRALLIVATIGIIVLAFYDSFKPADKKKVTIDNNLKKKKKTYFKIKSKRLKINQSSVFCESSFALVISFFIFFSKYI